MKSSLFNRNFFKEYSSWFVNRFDRPEASFGYMASGHVAGGVIPKRDVSRLASSLDDLYSKPSIYLKKVKKKEARIPLSRITSSDFEWSRGSSIKIIYQELDACIGLITKSLSPYAYVQIQNSCQFENLEVEILNIVNIVFRSIDPVYGYMSTIYIHDLAPMECSYATFDSTDIYMDRRLGLRSRREGPGVGGNAKMTWQFNLRYGLFADGILRDVLRENFLTQPHLDWDCKGQRFQDWIEADPTRGELTRFTDEMWRWSVPDESIAMIEEACFDFGLLQTRDQIEDYWRKKQAMQN